MADSSDIFLIGFSGSGKSTIGPELAKLLKAGFVDTDALIVKRTGQSISDLFRVKGEAYFRRTESFVIDSLLQKRSGPRVIALGGGAIEDHSTRQKVTEKGLLIYLSCSPEEIYRRLKDASDRPLLHSPAEVPPDIGETEETRNEGRRERIASLLKQRLPNYETAKITFDTTGKTPDQAAREIYKVIQNYNANH